MSKTQFEHQNGARCTVLVLKTLFRQIVLGFVNLFEYSVIFENLFKSFWNWLYSKQIVKNAIWAPKWCTVHRFGAQNAFFWQIVLEFVNLFEHFLFLKTCLDHFGIDYEAKKQNNLSKTRFEHQNSAPCTVLVLKTRFWQIVYVFVAL